MPARTSPQHLIAFQGEPGAYSDLACRQVFPRMDDAALRRPSRTRSPRCARGRAALAMLPIENSVAGRVADIHHLLPDSGLHIIGEHFQRVNHHLLAVKGATLEDLKIVRSHVHALSQCRKLIRELGLKPEVAADTAGAAAEVARARRHERRGDRLGARRQGLRPRLARRQNIEDADAQHDALPRHGDASRNDATRMTASSSPPSSSACATCRRRSTRRWAASPPTAST